MPLDLSAAALLNAGSGLLVAGVGAYTLRVRPAGVPNQAFGAFALCWGFGGILVNLVPSLAPGDGAWLAWGLNAGVFLILAAAAPLVALALVFPRPLAGREWWLLGLAALPAGAFAALTWSAGPDIVGSGRHPGVPVLVGAHWLALFLLAGRFRAVEDADFRRQCGLMSAALALYPGIYGVEWLRRPESAGEPLLGLLIPGLATLLAALWLWNASAGKEARMARAVALLILAAALLGASFGAAGFRGASGTARLLAVLVLAYAVLRHQLLGIDLKVKWTIRQSTVAAVFIMVFFVASESAQAFFGEAAGSQWLGIGAAGLLVFAMAPLQRAAERVASAAVPLNPGSAAAPVTDRVERVRIALRLALRDGGISREEALALAGLAQDAGLGPQDYEHVRLEVEDELAGQRRRARRRGPA